MTDITNIFDDFIDGTGGEFERKLLPAGKYNINIREEGHQMLDNEWGKTVMLCIEEVESKNWINTFFKYEKPVTDGGGTNAKGIRDLGTMMRSVSVDPRKAVIESDGKKIIDPHAIPDLVKGKSCTAEIEVQQRKGKDENVVVAFFAPEKKADAKSAEPKKEFKADDTSFLDD